MSKFGKIKNNIKSEGEKCYVGIRTSDITYSSNFFMNSICFFADNNAIFAARINQNIISKEVCTYIKEKIQSFIKKYPNSRLYFYNQATAYNYADAILNKCNCLNPKAILDFLGNKRLVREWLCENDIPIVKYQTYMGNEIRYSSLTSQFPQSNAFVIQTIFGGGGIGTFYADKMNFSKVTAKLQRYQQYIVTPYLKNVSVNTHVFVAGKQTVLSPASIQIIEKRNNQLCYRGGDFCAFQTLPISIKDKVKKLSLKIANLLRNLDYCGVAGLDFIITPEGEVYCCEINARFQASTFLLDKYLQSHKLSKNEASSCFEINDMAFHGGMITSLCFEDCINLSCYYYYKDEIPIEYIKEKLSIYKENNIELYEDGLSDYLTEPRLNTNSYLFRAVFPHAICSISPDATLWVNNNISIAPLINDELSLKVALLNQGIRISDDIPNIKKGVYQSIDIKVVSSPYFKIGRILNCAYQIHLSQFSPFCIKVEGNKQILIYFQAPIAEVIIEKNLLRDLSLREQKILYLSTDRLRINLISGCENKNLGKGCKFCNLPVSETQFSLDEIKLALTKLKILNIPFRHILIGGGSCLSIDIWEKIMELCKFLKNDDWYREKPISLMTMLPPIEILPDLKESGIEEVAFNLEIANEQLATKLMPGKRSNGKENYYNIFEKAVSVFGVGNVRSALVVGLDTEKELYDEIVSLVNMRVIPCLSAFRALPNSSFEGMPGPDNKYLIGVYNNAVQIIKSIPNNIDGLGPKCSACRNNMLIL